MQAKMTQAYVQNLKAGKKLYFVRDTLLKGFMLSVSYGGKKTYCVDYKRPNGKRATYKIGNSPLHTVTEARDLAREFLAAIARGEDPTAPPVNVLTFEAFLNDTYEPWVIENRRSGDSTAYILKSNFDFLFKTPLEKITIAQIEQWRSQKKKAGLKASSLNRRITALKAAINWAVKRSLIENNPIAKLERIREEDSDTKVRYLSDEERERLMAALDEREKEIRDARNSHNKWLKIRNLPTSPTIEDGEFADHLKPLVLLCLSTGIRRNSLLSLKWRDVNFNDETIMTSAATSKSGKQYYVPMNEQVISILTQWRKQVKKSNQNSLVFPSPQTGKKMDNCNTAWGTLLRKANIQGFRWHDMRHDFASQLVVTEKHNKASNRIC